MNNSELLQSYDKKWREFKKLKKLYKTKLKESSKLFNEKIIDNSIILNPIIVNLYALLGGIPFQDKDINFLSKIQNRIFNSIKDERVYKVKQKNYGLECFVLKWHDEDQFDENNFQLIKNYLNKLNLSKYKIKFKGIQIHTDGCVIARFIDINNEFRSLRKDCLLKFNFLPKKQSSWVHVPLGRILYDLDKKEIENLIYECEYINEHQTFEIEINKYSLVHEKRWYMEEKEILYIKNLNV